MLTSNRIAEFSFSPIRKLTPYANEAKSRGIKVYHLNIGQPDIKTPKQVYDYLHNLDPGIIAYGQSEGEPELRKAFAGYYHSIGLEEIDPSDILITTGGSEGILFLFMVLCDPGSEAVITEPFYTNVQSFAQMAQVRLRPVTSRLEDKFKLPSISSFEEAITPKTRMIMLNSPNNPTGHIYTPDELSALLEICKRHDIALVVDEVYREFCYDGQSFTSILSYAEHSQRIFCVDSLSKRFSMCGARIGAIVSKNHEVLNECLKLSQARLCPPVIEEGAAIAAMTAPPEYIAEVKTKYEARRNCIVSELQKIPGVRCCSPRGAFYLIADLPVDDAESFCIFMLRDFSCNGRTVMMAPANGFYINTELGRSQVRLAYVLKEDDLRDAMTCLRKGLEAYSSRH
ncbi:MAG: pyridoxal phosphate-dependent aminotransferase [Sphaerochaetaceae bacterium]